MDKLLKFVFLLHTLINHEFLIVGAVKVQISKNRSLLYKSAKFSAFVNFDMLFHLKAGHTPADHYFGRHLEFQNGRHNFYASIFESEVE